MTVLIGSDNRLLARLLREHLTTAFDASAIDIAVDGPSAFARLEAGGVDVVVVDSSMEDAQKLVRQATAERPSTRAIVFGLRKDEREIGAFAEAGAAGLALRDADLAEIGQTIRSAALGECSCCPWVAAALLRYVGRTGRRSPPAGPDGLTAREAEIARLLDAGHSNKEIARVLSIEVATVKNHVHSILRKLNVPSRAKAVAELRSVGIL